MAFDRAALTYDAEFTARPLGEWLRGRVWSWLDVHLQPGMAVLDLGCGTGEDAAHFARRGVHITAVDSSPAMLDITAQKTRGLPVTTTYLDLTQSATWTLTNRFDAAYSNFGALNCTPHWEVLARWLAERIRPGGFLGLAVMGRFCLWETLWHGLHADFRTASRRWAGQGEARLPDGAIFPVYYPTPRSLKTAFAPYFRFIGVRGLGVFIPPSDSFGVVEKRPRLHHAVTALERQFAAVLPSWGDHFWLELERLP